MLPGPSGQHLRTCAQDHMRPGWRSTEESTRLVVEAPSLSEPHRDAKPMQLEESEERRKPKRKTLPPNVSREEYDSHSLTHLPFRSWCDHCVKGKAVDGAHRPRMDWGEAKMGMDYFLARATDPQHAQAANCLDFQSGAMCSTMVVKGGDPYALAVALEAIKFTGRTRWIIMSDRENAVKILVDMIKDSSTHEIAIINTPRGWSASDGGIERANYEVEKQIQTLRSRFEENYA